MKDKVYFESGSVYNLSKFILNQTHVLIGGTTRSGKSVLLNTTICDAMNIGALFYFIDLKGVELDIYRDTPFCLGYCDNIYKVESAIDNIIGLMEQRFREMKYEGARKSNKIGIYLVIDEYVDIKYSKDINTNRIESKIMRVVSKGAAANVHVILCTQHCTNKTLTTNIKALFTTKIGLRVVNAQESRNIIGESGCELLPMYGCCRILSPDFLKITDGIIDMYSDEEIQAKVSRFIEYNELCKKEENVLYRILKRIRHGKEK